MERSSTVFVGMDAHKESIEIAIADGRETRHFGRIPGDAAKAPLRCPGVPCESNSTARKDGEPRSPLDSFKPYQRLR
jgi:hypothetical protein